MASGRTATGTTILLQKELRDNGPTPARARMTSAADGHGNTPTHAQVTSATGGDGNTPACAQNNRQTFSVDAGCSFSIWLGDNSPFQSLYVHC
jgi:hypothetical protein